MSSTPRHLSLFAGLALSLLPALAAATPTTAADLAAMRALTGFDKVPGAVADQLLANPGAPPTRDAAQRACVRSVLVGAYAAKTDAALKRTFATHEDVLAWQRFAATRGGRALLDHLREGVLAMSSGRKPPLESALDAKLDATARADIEAFVATPLGAKGPPRLEALTNADAAAIDRQVQRCGVGSGP
jgi:hypothetical protein